jgi:hypothetical protein
VANPTSIKETPEKQEVYCGVVGMDIVPVGFILGGLRNLDCVVGDIGNAFLYGQTREKVCIIAGSELGDTLKGKRLVVYKGLYGLTTSAARCHEVLSADGIRTHKGLPRTMDQRIKDWF